MPDIISPSRPVLTNCTFGHNTAGESGGGIYSTAEFDGNTTPLLENCIAWGNSPDEIVDVSGAVTTVNYTDVQGGWPGAGGNNMDADPLFVNPGHWDDNGTPSDPSDDCWIEGDYRLQPGSPCINLGGQDSELGGPDLDGHARELCSRVDMGAYEFAIGDFDCDQVVDLADFASWASCMTGPENGSYADGCETFDFEFDGDVDLHDVSGLLQVFSLQDP